MSSAIQEYLRLRGQPPPPRLTPEQAKDAQWQVLWGAMLRYEDRHRENIALNLKESLRCAHIGNWMGMEHCLTLYNKEESRHLGALANFTEEHGIVAYLDPHDREERMLFIDLLGLLIDFLSTAAEEDTRLRQKYQEEPTRERWSDAVQHRHNASQVNHVAKWIATFLSRNTVVEARATILICLDHRISEAACWPILAQEIAQ